MTPGATSPTTPGAIASVTGTSGNAWKKALASRAMASAAGRPAGEVPSDTPCAGCVGVLSRPEAGTARVWTDGSGVVIVLVHFHVLEHRDRILGQHGGRAVERDQVRGDGLAIDAREPDREARR